MRFNGPLGYVLSGSAVLALLAGCSGGGSSSPATPLTPTTSQSTLRSVDSVAQRGIFSTSVLRPGVARISAPDLSAGFADVDAAAKGAVVVSDGSANTVSVFSTTGKKVATITGFNEPQGLTADTKGDIYVADTGNSKIEVYKNDYKTLLMTLTDASQYPVGVSYDPTTGSVGVTNIVTTAGGPGSVSIYPKGKTTPCVTVSSSTFARVYFDAFDDAGNLFVDGQNSSGVTVVGEVTGGCKAKTITTLTTSNAISFPGGIQVSPTDGIAIDDQSGPAIYTYKAPVKGSLGKAVTTTPLTGAGDPVSFAFTSTAKDLWTADATNAAANEYAYPKGGSPVQTISGFTQPIGVVVTPVEQP